MRVIPVIDLLHGQVVHARRGDRANYRPIQSSLCQDSEPLSIVAALLRLHPFETLYIADLDSIQGFGQHRNQLREIRSAFPALELWVDSGISSRKELEMWFGSNLGTPIIGSESIHDEQALEGILGAVRPADWILSLDFRGDTFLGPYKLLIEPDLWAGRVLAMNLARVGSGNGPDTTLVERLSRLAPDREIYAAGGVRNISDLRLAIRAGASGALIATAFHDSRITQEDLRNLSEEHTP